MPLNRLALKADIIAMTQELQAQTENPNDAIETYAEKLSLAIDDYVKGATVVVPDGTGSLQ